ncbi:hypothetical protein [Bacillus thuringiensis]|uniref:hypothetical protein n=1 Tax=Bacillus thuringiensis TaxID=1428 RepID=UPI000D0415BF|nr:hypothetical protein [Bacillus thuringiensis]MED2798138.1 hypothetical protein [Bacillus thuringiensis]PRT27549.1 hypothetical protein C6351_17770 [Bacillus thuringiensis]
MDKIWSLFYNSKIQWAGVGLVIGILSPTMIKMDGIGGLFYDSKIQWPGVAATVALFVGILSPIITIYNNRKTLNAQKETNRKSLKIQQDISKENIKLQKEMNISNFKGNVVSKSRIEWIQEVRKLSVAFISSFYNLTNYVNELELDGFFNEATQEKRIGKIKKNQELMKLINALKEKGTLLILYFGPDANKNSNNEFINYMVRLIMSRADGLGSLNDANDLLKQEDNIRSLQDFLRIYFKAEWKRANGELNDSNIQSYLDTNEIYNHIIKSYETGFESHIEETQSFYTMKRIEELRRN